MTYVIRSAWPARLRNVALIGAGATVAFGLALGVGTGSLGLGLGFGAVVALLFGGVVFLFHDKEVRGVPGAVACAVDADGVYLGNPPRQLPWERVRAVRVYELRRRVGMRSVWFPQLAVHTDAGTEVAGDLLLTEPLDVAELRAAVHAHAPDVVVTDLGGVDDAP
jgi:hypothetical protein